jgi:hypothetical protein
MSAPHPKDTNTMRQIVRTTAAKILRSDDLIAGEKEAAIVLLRAHPEIGNAHAVRCDWCRETRTLFADEEDGPFVLATRGWKCSACSVNASSQEIKF